MKWFFYIIFFVLLVGYFQNANAQDSLDFDNLAFLPIGVVDNIKSGTGFLVSECHVLTNYHVAFAPNLSAPSKNVKSQFYIGKVAIPGEFSAYTEATPLVWGNYLQNGRVNVRGDWALLKLKNCLGKKYGFYKISQPITDANLTFAGYAKPQGLFELILKTQCYLKNHSQFGLISNCQPIERMSGSPAIDFDNFSSPKVVGLFGGSSKQTNNGVVISSKEFYSQISAYLAP